MLKTRIITALVLLGVLIPTLIAVSPTPFLLLSALMICAAGWEWARLNGRAGSAEAAASGVGLAALCWLAWSTVGSAESLQIVWWSAAGLWVFGVGLALRFGSAGWARLPPGLRWALGWVLLGIAWLAMARARTVGVNFLLSTMCIVWAADIAAYFGGRAFGRRKLAPSISPGKSWAGVYSGIVGVMVLALIWLAIDSQWQFDSTSIFTVLHRTLGPLGLALGLVVLTGLSVAGDLFESLVKRAAGAKDSSGLLPGHGGVLDRVDALLPVMPAAMALASL